MDTVEKNITKTILDSQSGCRSTLRWTEPPIDPNVKI